MVDNGFMKPPQNSLKKDAFFIFGYKPIYIILIVFIMLPACTFTNKVCQGCSDVQQSLGSTITALKIQATGMAQQATSDSQQIQTQAANLSQQQNLLLTQLVSLPTKSSQPSESGGANPKTTAQLTITPSPPQSAVPTQMDDVKLQAKMQAAKILLFEDISGSKTHLPRFVKETLDKVNYSYTDVGSGQGWLKEQLESDVDWDLIIVSSEVGGRISGEFFDYLSNYAAKGTAIILELWGLDEVYQGKSKTFLDDCGIEFEMDWSAVSSSPLWFLQPDNPIFHEPNELDSRLRYFKRLWPDGGDLVKIKKYGGKVVGDATLLIGTQMDITNSHAVLTSCMGGRVLIQTFASHQYHSEDILKLWENYIYYTLKNHFIQSTN